MEKKENENMLPGANWKKTEKLEEKNAREKK